MLQRNFEDLFVGESASIRQTATEEYIQKMAELTGDNNLLHLDEEYAKTSLFGQRIAHGLFCDGMLSTILGTNLPGAGTIYMEKHIQFRAPVFIDDEIETTVAITGIDAEKRIIDLSFKCAKNDAAVVAKGKVRVKMM